MKYIDTFKLLKEKTNYTDNQITIPDVIEVRNFTFTSDKGCILPSDSSNDTRLGYD